MGGFKVNGNFIRKIERLAQAKCDELAEEARKKLETYYIKNVLNWFYSSYSPKMYERTYELYNHSYNSKMYSNGSGSTAFFEMSNDNMNYHESGLINVNKRTLGVKIENEKWSREGVAFTSFWEGTHGWYVPSGILPWFEMIDYADELIDHYKSICTGD